MCNRIIVILGPTASGKTTLAVRIAARLDGEIISGDSRQVYSGMDIGTGKDLGEYVYKGKYIPYHLIDIAKPGEKYTLFHYQQDFLETYHEIRKRGKSVIFCGGSGLYLESVLRSYRLSPVPINQKLRSSLSGKTLAELTQILSSYKKLHNITDVDTVNRAIRAIEIEDYYRRTPLDGRDFPHLESVCFGIDISREIRRARISKRLTIRMGEGMIKEVRDLLDTGINPDDLIYYGLEYKYLTLYLLGKLSYREMYGQLEIAIHQFAKRQMTWFRGMERRGVPINWIDGSLPIDSMVDNVIGQLEK